MEPTDTKHPKVFGYVIQLSKSLIPGTNIMIVLVPVLYLIYIFYSNSLVKSRDKIKFLGTNPAPADFTPQDRLLRNRFATLLSVHSNTSQSPT